MAEKNNITIFNGSSSRLFAERVCKHLFLKPGDISVGRFNDGEVKVELNESIRGKDVFLIHTICPPINDNLVELLIIADALKRSSPERITAVLPYLAYSRQDRRVRSSRVPISAKVVAELINSVGIDRILTVDIHSEQIQGFYSNPILDNLYSTPIFLNDIDYLITNKVLNVENLIIISPDVGGVQRARAIAKCFNLDIAIIDKRRTSNGIEYMNIIGDVENKDCIIIDDIVDTAGTLCKATHQLIHAGKANSVSAYITHPVLSGDAVNLIKNSELKELIVTDTISLSENYDKIRQITISDLFAKAIWCLSTNNSITSLFY